MKQPYEGYTKQVLGLMILIGVIYFAVLGFVAVFGTHSMFDYDVGVDILRGENNNGIITLEGKVTNYGNEHLDFIYALYINDEFIAEKTYMLDVGQYIEIVYKYDARDLGYAIQNFDAEVWSEYDQNPENNWESTYVTTGRPA